MTDHVDASLIAAARAGDRLAFDTLIAPYQRELLVHCYRLLGTLQDAEDIVQETMVRAWQRLASFQARGSLRAWLYRIATNASLDLLDRPERRYLLTGPLIHPQQAFKPIDGERIDLDPLPEAWLGGIAESPEAGYTLRESVTLAFLTALRVLPPRQRVVLLMREVLAWPAAEVGEMLEMTVPAVNSALHRAREAMEQHRVTHRPAEWSPAPDDERTRQLLDRYVLAWEAADINAMVALFREDARVTMPPDLLWLDGRAAIRAFVLQMAFAGDESDGRARGRWRALPARANGQPALALYHRADDEPDLREEVLFVLSYDADLIAAMTAFRNPDLANRHGLPASLPAPLAVR